MCFRSHGVPFGITTRGCRVGFCMLAGAHPSRISIAGHPRARYGSAGVTAAWSLLRYRSPTRASRDADCPRAGDRKSAVAGTALSASA